MKRINFIGLVISIFIYQVSVMAQNNEVTMPAPSAPTQFTLSLEAESATTRDNNLQFNGSETFLRAEPGFKFSKTQSISFGGDYWIRSYNPATGDSESTIKRKERDELYEAFFKYNYKYSLSDFSMKLQNSFNLFSRSYFS
ncbi:MAG: hypothetical protein KDD50_15140 [Bdellovibrionales bacterium]|nr:hypothetical protein [Bdellovibrionales bacterium]